VNARGLLESAEGTRTRNRLRGEWNLIARLESMWAASMQRSSVRVLSSANSATRARSAMTASLAEPFSSLPSTAVIPWSPKNVPLCLASVSPSV
jgi:hypothetical protein